MQVIKPLAVAFSLLAFASVSAFADDAKKNQSASQAKPSMSQSDTKSSAGATRLDFDKADKNKDGQLSRAEFDAMLKGDTTASAGASTKKDDKASAGASAKPDRSKTSK